MAHITKPHPIPGALGNIDALPDSAHVRQPVLEALFACSGETILQRVKAGTLPAPKKLSDRVTVWSIAELKQFLHR
jgi:predicted DNA-binding transcriptional regulator AlpA